MFPRPPLARLAACTLLAALALVASTAIASPPPFGRTAAADHPHPLSPPAIAPGARASLPPATSADGTWQELYLLQTRGALAVHDAVHDELIVLAAYPRAESRALPLAGPRVWHALPALSPAGIYLGPTWSVEDPSTGLVYFFARDMQGFLEVRTLDPLTGVSNAVPAAGTPPYSFQGILAFDAAGQRLIVLGSTDFDNEYAQQVLVLDLLPAPAWTEWTPAGPPPPIYYPPPAIVDPVRRQLLLPSRVAPGLMWALTLDGPPQWLTFPTNGLPSNYYPSPIVYDPASDRLWTIDEQGVPYSMSLVTHEWSPVSTSGPAPSPRRSAAITIDPVRHRLLVSGGGTPSGDDTHSDTWALSLDGPPEWVELVPDAMRPPVRGGASDGLDITRNRLVVFGGSDEVGGFRNDTWALDLGATPSWSPIATQGPLPPGRYWHASAWDEARDQLVVFGGYNGDSVHPLGDLWVLSFAGATPTWSPLTPSGPAPVARMSSQLVYDSAGDRLLLFFGLDGAQVLGDVWELRFSPAPAWRILSPAGTPPAARASEMCAHDPDHDRVLVFGGGPDYMNDLWALNLGGGDGTWQEFPTLSGPSGRIQGLLRLDTAHNRLVLFGGWGVRSEDPHGRLITMLNDTWALDLAGTPAWHELSPAGFLPPARDRANGAYDALYDRLVVACGTGNGSNDTWTLTFGDAPTPTLLALASSDVSAERVRLMWAGAEPNASVTAYRREPAAEWRSLGTLFADGRGFITLEDSDVTPGATLEYRLGVTRDGSEAFYGATQVRVPRRALELAARAVGAHASFTVQLATDDPATLALYDVAGRRIWSRELGLGAGAHEVAVSGVTLPPAMYFARLAQGRASRVARVVIVR